MKLPAIFAIAAALAAIGALGVVAQHPTDGRQSETAKHTEQSKKDVFPASQKIVKTEEEWRKILPPDQFEVTRKAGTERPFTGKYADFHGKGIYQCADCGLDLFDSKTKFESGTGWPSFYAPLIKRNVEEREDRSLGDVRTEVLCARCGAHLGHVFDDGPRPTGLRYCMNSIALKFVAKK